MRQHLKAHRLVALVFAGLWASAARGQAPYYYGAPSPYAYGAVAPSYAPPAQPRVMYVPATPTDWIPGWGNTSPVPLAALSAPKAPASSIRQASTAPVLRPALPTAQESKLRSNESDPLLLYDGVSHLEKRVKGRKQASADVIALAKEKAEPAGVSGLPPITPPAALLSDCPSGACGNVCSDVCSNACGIQPCAAFGPAPEDNTNWLPKGHWNMQMMFGHYWDVDAANYNWAPVHLRLGRVWKCPHVNGAFEPMLDLTTAMTSESDFGDWFIGPSVILRYNFVQPGARLVPYVQGGVGFQYNDAYQDPNPTTGSHLELTAQLQTGMRIFVKPNWSLDFEWGYQHISNMNMNERDEGFNALGATMGMSYFFGWCHR